VLLALALEEEATTLRSSSSVYSLRTSQRTRSSAPSAASFTPPSTQRLPSPGGPPLGAGQAHSQPQPTSAGEASMGGGESRMRTGSLGLCRDGSSGARCASLWETGPLHTSLSRSSLCPPPVSRAGSFDLQGLSREIREIHRSASQALRPPSSRVNSEFGPATSAAEAAPAPAMEAAPAPAMEVVMGGAGRGRSRVLRQRTSHADEARGPAGTGGGGGVRFDPVSLDGVGSLEAGRRMPSGQGESAKPGTSTSWLKWLGWGGGAAVAARTRSGSRGGRSGGSGGLTLAVGFAPSAGLGASQPAMTLVLVDKTRALQARAPKAAPSKGAPSPGERRPWQAAAAQTPEPTAAPALLSSVSAGSESADEPTALPDSAPADPSPPPYYVMARSCESVLAVAVGGAAPAPPATSDAPTGGSASPPPSWLPAWLRAGAAAPPLDGASVDKEGEEPWWERPNASSVGRPEEGMEARDRGSMGSVHSATALV